MTPCGRAGTSWKARPRVRRRIIAQSCELSFAVDLPPPARNRAVAGAGEEAAVSQSAGPEEHGTTEVYGSKSRLLRAGSATYNLSSASATREQLR